MIPDIILTAANCLFAAALFALFMGRRVYRTLPIFTAYVGYSLLFVLAALAAFSSVSNYLVIWNLGIAIDTVFYLLALVELGKAVLRYNRASPLPWPIVLLLFLAAGLPIALLAQWPDLPRLEPLWQITCRVLQTTAIVEVAALLTMVWWSAFQKLHWPERELRLVMGMATWALVQLGVLVLHEHGLIGPGYHWLDLLTPAAVLGVVIYWLHWFWFDSGSRTPAAALPGAQPPLASPWRSNHPSSEFSANTRHIPGHVTFGQLPSFAPRSH